MLMCSYTHYWNLIIYVLISHTFYECGPTQLKVFFYHIIISCPAMKPSLAKVTLLGFYKGMKVNRWPMHVISIVTVYHWPMPTIYQHSYDRWCFLEWAHQNMTQTIYIKPRILPSCPTVNKYVGNWPCRRPHEYHQSLSSYLGNSLCSSLRHMSNKSMNFWGNWAKSTNNPCWVFRLKKKSKSR